MKTTLLLLSFLFTSFLAAQITGNVTDKQGNSLPFVNIYIQDTYTGTTTNGLGYYELNVSEAKKYTLVFQYLGYKQLIKEVTPSTFPYSLDIVLEEESVSLSEVVINATEDPAYEIIRKTIAQHKVNQERIAQFTADFYSRGLWRVSDMPEKILGQDVGDFDGALDSTRTGIIYLSETISEIAYQQPDDFKEKIIASKVSGNDNGFSFNSAQDANFSFYNNTIDISAAIVSPIAVNGLSYYTYKLDGVFYEGDKLINKITVTPRRPKDRTFSGTIYIVEDDWQLYGVELSTTGEAIQVPMIENLFFKQNFTFDENENAWVKISQSIDFAFKFFGVQGDGRFIAVYSDYDFKPNFEKRSFTNEVLSFGLEANKKDSTYWQSSRPIALTSEEFNDYIKKDSIQTLRKSQKYTDSIDAKGNKFSLLDPIMGYSYRDTFNKWSLNYKGPIPNINYNTVQGWNGGVGLNYFKGYNENNTSWLSANVDATYSIAEDRVRFDGGITRSFNQTNRRRISITGGNKVSQYNAAEPISPIINTITSLFFERNYMKVYDLTYARVGYGQEIINGLRVNTSFGYEKRRHLFNNTDYVTLPKDDINYTTNNPLDANAVNNPLLASHETFKSYLSADITFAQKYMSYPDGKYNLGAGKYPRLNLSVENGIGINNSDINFTQLSARLRQRITLRNKGETIYNLKASTFIHGDDILFADYQHFNGNQTRIGTSGNYTNVFNLLPYYEMSTNKSHVEGHIEHDFKGWILGKIPGINQLNFNLVAGAHALSIEGKKPYTELSLGIDNLGIGKYRLLRLDYVRSFYGDQNKGAFVFGLKFLNFIQ
ncbi:hypothetical protein SCB49_00807 [unidentified eubacterium SCB49]|nr:hypothetical protein SCB49_00807 [unidentified eubacterium SCB49]